MKSMYIIRPFAMTVCCFDRFYQSILEYLMSFWDRLHPLYSANLVLSKNDENFEQLWNSKQCLGWHIPYPKKKPDLLQKYKKDIPAPAPAVAPAPAPAPAPKPEENEKADPMEIEEEGVEESKALEIPTITQKVVK